MNKTLTFFSMTVLLVFGLMTASAHAATPIATGWATGWDRPHEFSEISLTFVKNPQGQYLGRITDLVFDPEGQITFAILSRPGIIGIPGNPIAVPFNTLSYDNKDRVCVLDLSWERLQSAPVFSKRDLSNRKWAEDTYRYFGQQPYWTEEGSQKESPAMEKPKEAVSMTTRWQRPYEVSEILGTHAMNPHGEDLGRISDLVFDTEGRISFAILAHGGFLRIGEKRTAIPFPALSYESNEKHFVLDATRERLEAAPVFSKKTLGDLQWAEEVYRYFGQQPYWTERELRK